MPKTTVQVTYDSNSNTLALETTKVNVDLNPEDVLEWEFLNVPSDCVPGILFGSEPLEPESAFGPFQVLELVLADNIVQGRGNIGVEKSYSYKPQLLDANGVLPAIAETGKVRSRTSVPDTSPMLVITCQTNPETGDPEIVPPSIPGSDTLRLLPGDTAIWYVTGLPLGCFVSFLFTLSSDAAGPFESLLFHRPLESSGAVGVVGVGFNPPSGSPRQIPYSIQIRDAFGKIVDHHDPQIDNLGQPPQG